MENTMQSARDFIKSRKQTNPMCCETWSQIAQMMVSFTSACSAPSSIGEDEIEAEIHKAYIYDPHDVSGHIVTESFRQGAKWAISRLSERKIVLPSDGESHRMNAYGHSALYRRGWDECLSEIKRLNGIN